jgi:hypothetical protein
VVALVMQGYRVLALCADDTLRVLDVAAARLIKSVPRAGVGASLGLSDTAPACRRGGLE